MRPKEERRIVTAFLASLLLHLLALVVMDRLVPKSIQKVLFPVQFREEQPMPERFELAPSTSIPGLVEMKRLEVEGRPEELKQDATPFLPVPKLPQVRQPRVLEQPRFSGEKSPRFEAPEDTLLSMEALNLAMVQRRIEEIEQYQRLVLPDADVDDEESRSRTLAQQVIMEAVEAMGGMQVLSNIRDMTLLPVNEVDLHTLVQWKRWLTEAEIEERLAMGRFYFKSYGLGSKYAQYLPGGARLVCDGKRAWVQIGEKQYELREESLQAVRNRTERWDFLSRYLGDGVRVSYMGTKEDGMGPSFHVIKVEDMKFSGVSFRALFDQKTRLLAAEEFPAEKPRLRKRYQDYRPVGEALIWNQIVDLPYGRPTPDTLAVDYGRISDEVFAPTRSVRTDWEGLADHEYEATLWVDAAFGKRSFSGVPATTPKALGLVDERQVQVQVQRDTSRYYLTYEQKRMVEDQIRQIVAADLNKRGLFAQITVMEEGALVQPQDYVLRIRPLLKKGPQQLRGQVFYGAELFMAASNEIIVKDGPLPENYFTDNRFRRICSIYGLPVFMIEAHIAYVSEGKLKALLERTYGKVRQGMEAYLHGEPDLFTHSCCLCQEP